MVKLDGFEKLDLQFFQQLPELAGKAGISSMAQAVEIRQRALETYGIGVTKALTDNPEKFGDNLFKLLVAFTLVNLALVSYQEFRTSNGQGAERFFIDPSMYAEIAFKTYVAAQNYQQSQ